MKLHRCYWIAKIGGSSKQPRPVVTLDEHPEYWILAITGTTQDRPDREPPTRLCIEARTRAGKALNLSKDTWFDRLGFTLEIEPHRFEEPSRYISKRMISQLIDMLHETARLGLLAEKVEAAMLQMDNPPETQAVVVPDAQTRQ